MKHLTFFSKLWLYLTIGFFLANVAIQAQTLVTAVEAETGVRSGGVIISNSVSGYSGTGYVTNFTSSSDKVTVTVTVPSKALYSISVRYRSTQYKEQYFFVNSVASNNLVLQPSSIFTDVDAGKFLLNAGNNTITVQSYWGYSDIDKFSVYTVPANTYNITPNLVDTNATAETKALYNYLLSNYQKKIISGQTSGFYDSCKILSGRSPIIRGFDMQHYTRGYSYLWANGGFSFGWDDSHESENAINWYNQTGKKGIVAFQWHWHSPTGGQVGTNTFYTQYTTFDASKAVVPGNQEYTDIIRDIDSIATQLKKFQRANIPVIFRPLHEASGNGAVDGSGAWFWWGAKGASVCRKLYNIIYDRITNYHGIHNLIWAWSSMETAWYPGNDSIDIVGYDSYPGNYNYTTQKKYFDILYDLTSGNKLIALTENGPIPNPGDCMASDAPWSYFMSWDNLLRAQNSKQHIISVYNDSSVLILEPSQPMKPSGVTKLCINPADQMFTTQKRDGVTSYLWRIFPSSAGVVSGTDTFCTVNFSNTYSGTAKLVVNGKNSIGTGQTSDTLAISVSDVPGKAGTPIGATTLSLNPATQIYTTTGANAAISYIWKLTPDTAGTMAGIGIKDTIDFSDSYTGTIGLVVAGQNSCGIGAFSDTLKITVAKPDGYPVINQNTEFQVFPNPASQKVYAVVGNDLGNYSLEMMNAAGLTVFKSAYTKPGKNEITISNLPQGIYVLCLKSNTLVLKEKILITK